MGNVETRGVFSYRGAAGVAAVVVGAEVAAARATTAAKKDTSAGTAHRVVAAAAAAAVRASGPSFHCRSFSSCSMFNFGTVRSLAAGGGGGGGACYNCGEEGHISRDCPAAKKEGGGGGGGTKAGVHVS